MTANQRSIEVTRTLRPLRLGFLIDPGDAASVRSVIQAATCRWGGIGCPVIPLDRRLDGPGIDLLATAKGYLNSFEPDFVIEVGDVDARGLGVDENLSRSFEDLEDREGLAHLEVNLGVSSFLIYSEAYEKELRFLHRAPRDALVTRPAGSPTDLLVSAIVGAFPDAGELAAMKGAYEESFEPIETAPGPTDLPFISLSQDRPMTPLRASMSGLRRHGMNVRDLRQDLFVLVSETEPADIVDFWNLRASGARVSPVPVGSLTEWVAAYADMLRREGVDLPTENPRYVGMAVPASRVDQEHVKLFTELMGKAGIRTHRRPVYRPFSNRHLLELDRSQPLRFEAATESNDFGVEEGWLRFPLLGPTATKDIPTVGAAWANVVSLREWGWSSELAGVIPADLGDVSNLFGVIGIEDETLTVNREGLVARTHWYGSKESWRVPDGAAVFVAWMEKRGFKARRSSGGRAAEQVIRTLGGPPAASIVRDRDLIELLDKAASGLVESLEETSQPRRRVIVYPDLIRVLSQIEGNLDRARARIVHLLQRNVLRQGLLVKCSLCEQENWYQLSDLEEQLRCERCLGGFDFPRDQPPDRNRWAYRTSGPFSAPNYAEGGYGVALALRFLTSPGINKLSTWTTGTILERGDEELEFDLGVWVTHGFGPESTAHLVMAECKTFGRFEPPDITRAEKLAREFPEARIALTTLRDELDEDEKSAILAVRDRLGPEGFDRLLVLTGHELCQSGFLRPPRGWHTKGGRLAEVADRFKSSVLGIEGLGAMTLAAHVESGD